MSEHIWFINGVEGSALPLDDRGLAYGDGLFETMRVIDSDIPLRDFHQSRLMLGCQKLGIDLDENLVCDQINKVLCGSQAIQSVIKVIVTRGGAASGYAHLKELNPNIYIRLSQLNTLNGPLDGKAPQLDLQFCSMRLSMQPALAGIKHLNRLEQVMAAAEISDPSKEGILMDTEGHIIEALSSNLIIVIKGILYFPNLACSGVQGVMQTYLAKLCRKEGVAAQTTKITFGELTQASEVLACNSVRGVRNISSISGSENNSTEIRWKSSSTEIGSNLRARLEQVLNTEFYSF